MNPILDNRPGGPPRWRCAVCRDGYSGMLDADHCCTPAQRPCGGRGGKCVKQIGHASNCNDGEGRESPKVEELDHFAKLNAMIAKFYQVSISANEHRTCNESVTDYILSLEHRLDLDVGPCRRCIESDSIIEIQVYPRTAVGFHWWCAPTMEEAIDVAYAELIGGGEKP